MPLRYPTTSISNDIYGASFQITIRSISTRNRIPIRVGIELESKSKLRDHPTTQTVWKHLWCFHILKRYLTVRYFYRTLQEMKPRCIYCTVLLLWIVGQDTMWRGNKRCRCNWKTVTCITVPRWGLKIYELIFSLKMTILKKRVKIFAGSAKISNR